MIHHRGITLSLLYNFLTLFVINIVCHTTDLT